MIAIALITCGIMAYNIIRYVVKEKVTNKDLMFLVINGLALFGMIILVRGDI